LIRRLRNSNADEAAGFAVAWALILVALGVVMATTSTGDVAFAGWLVLGPFCVASGAGTEMERSTRAAFAAARVRRAMRRRQLRLHFQPEVDVQTGEVRSVEALIRWDHPRLGLVSPDRFVPQMERGWHAHGFNAYVIEEAVREASAWNRDGRPLRVAVNVSISSLGPDLVDTVGAALDRHRLPGHLLQVELTEGGPADPFGRLDACAAPLSELKARGVSVALDDFGTGQSSLARLVSLPTDMIKIDRCFVIPMLEDPLRWEIVRSAIALGRTSGVKVVAEGIETEAHMVALRRLGVDMVQGFALAVPMPAEKLRTWLEARRPQPATAPERLPRRRDRRLPVPAAPAAVAV
jgi:EAL domain-containing protein (putative c-di-GMP-specific phosphodiesterase class I)